MRLSALASIAMLLLAPAVARAETSMVDSLASRGALGIPAERARQLEDELGQLFVINVDGFGFPGAELALEPDFGPLVERLQVGGVIPHYGSSDYERIRRTNHALFAMTRLPLLVCCDIVWLRARTDGGVARASFGDGYIGGFIGKFRSLPDPEFQTLARLNAFVFAALGMNVALGPTVDDSTRDPATEERARQVVQALTTFGLQPVLKHFPFLPTTANLHHASPDTRVPPDAAEKRFSVFRDLSGLSPIMMTTHLNDSLVDSRIVTFSKAWLGILRRETGYKGLLMSDGLLMLRNYASPPGPGSPELAGLDATAAWAVRAILAGHDFIIVEGSAAQTLRAFGGVLAEACRGTEMGNELAARIEESFQRIKRFKAENQRLLSRRIEVPMSTITAIISMVPKQSSNLGSFRFSRNALASVAPELAGAAIPPEEKAQ
jgi:beta-glucosidase-like glycosyl hydrolase